jgi:hypothetical protein
VATLNDPNANILLHIMPGQDQRWYNLPSSDKVTVILSRDGTAPERQDIVLCPCSDGHSFARINDAHPVYSPLHYVLLFPYSDYGWHYDLYHRPIPGLDPSPNWNPPCISQTQYSSFCLHTHNSEYSIIHRGGRLFQQYIVDMWASADQTCISYLRFNQGRLRATLYSGLEDWLRANEIENPQDLNQRTVLPSSYIGSLRHQQQ